MKARVGEPIVTKHAAQQHPVAPRKPTRAVAGAGAVGYAGSPRSLEGFVRRRVVVPKSKPVAPHSIRPVAHHPQAVQTPRTSVLQHHVTHSVTPAAQPAVAGTKPAAKPASPKKLRFLTRFQMPLILLGAIFLGTLAQTLMIGQVLLAVYAVFVIWRGFASALSFRLALVGMVATAVSFVLQNGQLANTFAIYTFWLFAIGLLTLFIEIWRESHVDKRALRAARKLAKAKS